MAWKRQTKEEKERLHRRRRRQLLGGVLAVLIVVGVATVLSSAVGGVSKLFDNTKEKQSYEKLLAPMVMLDPVPFDNLAAADPDLLLQAAIWSTIYNEDLTKYDRDDVGGLILPTVDVEKYAAKLFGSDYHLTHRTFESSGMTFQYNEETKSYLIPVTGTTNTYTPQVAKIKSSVKEKIVTVGYLEPATGFSMDGNNTDSTKPVKYYDYVFTRQGDGYYLSSITDSEMKAEGQLASTSASEAVEQPQDITQKILEQAQENASSEVSSTPAG